MSGRNCAAFAKEVVAGPVGLSGSVSCAPFERYLGIQIEEATEEEAVLTMPFRANLSQTKGFMHGGAITSLAHSSLAVAIKSRLSEDNDIEIITFSVRFHNNTISGGVARAVARVTDMNERDIRGEAIVYDDHGNKIVTFGAAYRKDRVIKGH